MTIRLAILCHRQSASAYETLRETGVLKLPVQSTLRDHMNVTHPKSGFQRSVLEELANLAESLQDNERYVVLLHDEMTIKQDIFYDSRSSDIIGFVNVGSWKESDEISGHLATEALCFYVVNIVGNIRKSLGFFPTKSSTADQLYQLLLQAI